MRRARVLLYARIWREAVGFLGADFRCFHGSGEIEIVLDGRSVRVGPGLPLLDGAEVVAGCSDKRLVHRRLADAGLPVLEHATFTADDARPALLFLAEAGCPCVLKPRSASGGSGVTCGIRSTNDLRRAARFAGRFADTFLIERQLEGSVYRVLVLDGVALDVVRRDPPGIVGDGSSTIAELLLREDRRRLAAYGEAGLKPLVLDFDCLFTIRAAELGPQSVLERGRRQVVKFSTSQNAAEENATARDELAPIVVELAIRAAEASGLRLAGVDLLVPDAETSGPRARPVVLEVNARPGLHHHYLVSGRAGATPVARSVLSAMLSDS